jgi:hypothetical protein
MADETRTRMLNDGTGKPKNGFHWTFVAEDDAGEVDIAFVFAAGRSGETPRQVLGKSANPDSRPPHGSTRLDVMYRQAKRSAARSEPVPCTMAFSVAHETPGFIARQL